MRIAMVTEYAYPILGGVPEHVHNLSKEMVARGHEVTVLTSLAPFGMKRRARAIDAENLSRSRLPDREDRGLDADRLATARSRA